MKIIDKTPLQNDKGEISLVNRIQGTFKYGFDWYAEMEAQKNLVAQLNRSLEKGFVLIRNLNLPGSNFFIPLILIGTGGVYVIYATPAKGHFEAKGDQWNTIDASGNAQPAAVNLLEKAVKLTRAFQKFLEIHKIKITTPVETVLVTVDPGAHVETSRPVIKVIKSDVIKAFIASLQQAIPVWRPEFIYDLADRIAEPRMREDPVAVQPEPEPAPPPAAFGGFDASAPTTFDTGDFRSDFEEQVPVAQQPSAQPVAEKNARKPRPRPAPSKKIFGMTSMQFYIIMGFFLFWLCAMAGLGALILLGVPQ